MNRPSGRITMRPYGFMYDPRIHHRRSIRRRGHDYAKPGVYFLTIRTENKQRVLGEVRDGEMRLNSVGEIAATCWQWLAQRYPQGRLDAWIVMPNQTSAVQEVCGLWLGRDKCRRVSEMRNSVLPGLQAARLTASDRESGCSC